MDPLLMEQLSALVQVLIIDITLAGDNAVMIGLAVNGLPQEQRRKAIIWGIAGATLMRIAFGAVTLQLLAIVGLLLAGGVLLLWVCWKMYRDLVAAGGHDLAAANAAPAAPKTLRQAMIQIIVADVSMSLDNVLAVAGAAEGHPWILVIGITISVVLMGVAASFIAQLLEKHRWIAWVGLLIVLYVAVMMIWNGGWDVAEKMGWMVPAAAPAPR